jgi:AbrB family looped-hinge helix DNA binding protein
VVIPKDICDELGLQEGDFVEVTSAKGQVIITPKRVVDTDEVLTVAQRVVIDTRLSEAEEDIKAGRVSGPFAMVDHLKRHLNAPR